MAVVDIELVSIRNLTRRPILIDVQPDHGSLVAPQLEGQVIIPPLGILEVEEIRTNLGVLENLADLDQIKFEQTIRSFEVGTGTDITGTEITGTEP